MKFEVKEHMLFLDGKQVEYRPSPNHGGTIVPEYLIMHYTSDVSPASTISWFTSKQSTVSAQLLIERDGKVVQFVPFNLKAQHAGESEWKGVKMLNGHSIGIEMTNAGLLAKVGEKYYTLDRDHEVADHVVVDGLPWQPYTPAQVEVAKALADLLMSHYKLKEILGHSDIAPKRKIDPGKAWPWKFFKTQTLMTTKKTTKNVNLRIDPSLDFDPVQVIPFNTTLIVTEQSKNGFTYVKLNDTVKGWVSSQYIL